MSNMSYCRFENTDRDLADCEDALLRLVNLEEAPLSPPELDAAKSIARRCLAIVLALSDYVGADISIGDIDDPAFAETLASAVEAANEDAKATNDHEEG